MASRKRTSSPKKKTPAKKQKKKPKKKPITYAVKSKNKNGVTYRPPVATSRKSKVDHETFERAIRILGATTVARIIGAPASSVKSWANDTSKVPASYARYDVELSLTMRRYDYMQRRAAKVAKASKQMRTSYFEEYISLASKQKPSASENARIVQILLHLGIDPHRPESYLRGAT